MSACVTDDLQMVLGELGRNLDAVRWQQEVE
ncbi:Uncharacterised protein [Mycolicibacterium flavescens]|nr:Uncharacterised protein [Mycolicibacterium flavescens]